MQVQPRPDQIPPILRDFQADLDAGLNIHQACRKAGIGITIYARWKHIQEEAEAHEKFRISELEAGPETGTRDQKRGRG